MQRQTIPRIYKQLMGHSAKFERLSIREHHVYLSKKESFAVMEDLLKSNF